MFRRIRNRRHIEQAHQLLQEYAHLTPAPHADLPVPETGADAGEAFLPEELRLPPCEKLAGRMMRYEAPLEIGGVLRVCPQCGADRDWLLLNSGDNVWTRCRGGHERYEPSLDAMWFDQYCGPTETVHASHEEAMRSLGFDGTFAGIIL